LFFDPFLGLYSGYPSVSGCRFFSPGTPLRRFFYLFPLGPGHNPRTPICLFWRLSEGVCTPYFFFFAAFSAFVAHPFPPSHPALPAPQPPSLSTPPQGVDFHVIPPNGVQINPLCNCFCIDPFLLSCPIFMCQCSEPFIHAMACVFLYCLRRFFMYCQSLYCFRALSEVFIRFFFFFFLMFFFFFFFFLFSCFFFFLFFLLFFRGPKACVLFRQPPPRRLLAVGLSPGTRTPGPAPDPFRSLVPPSEHSH